MSDDQEIIHPILKMACRDFKGRLKKLKPFMSTEETRMYINGVFLHYKDLQLTLVATNGHILQEHVFSVEADLMAGYGEFEAIIPRTAVEALIKIMPSKKESMFTLQLVDKSKYVRFEFVGHEYTTSVIDCTYPDYKAVIPKGKIPVQFGLNAGYLIDALAALGNDVVDIAMDKHEEQEKAPHLLTSEGAAGIKCVIMPCMNFTNS